MHKLQPEFFLKKINMRRKNMINEMTLEMLKSIVEKEQEMYNLPTEVKEVEKEMELPKENYLLRLLKLKGFDPCYSSEEPIQVAKTKHGNFEPHLYPENSFLVGPTNCGKTTLALNLIKSGKYPKAEMLFVLQSRHTSPTQLNAWRSVTASDYSRIRVVYLTCIDSEERLDQEKLRILSVSLEAFGVQNNKKGMIKTLIAPSV